MNCTSPAVFLDRDGVINEEVGYITSPEQLIFYPFAREAINRLKQHGWKCIVISNQSGVARGMMTEEELQLINQKVVQHLAVDGIYYCPHLPPEGRDVPPYRIKCVCRKPGPGMIEQAAAEHHIDLSRSYLVGDRATDILAGQNACLKTVLVSTGYGSKEPEQPVQPDFTYPDLLSFVDFLLTREEKG